MSSRTPSIRQWLHRRGSERRTQDGTKTPSRIPAFEDFAIDQSGRFWIAVNTKRALENGQTEYWVFGPDGDLIRKVRFDRLVFLKAFTEKKAYGIATKPNGLQRIVRCSLSSLLPQ